MSAHVADTSFIVALFNPTDEHHGTAVKMYEAAGSILVHQDVLKESLTVLMYRLGLKEARRIYAAVLNTESFKVGTFGLEDAFEFWFSLGRRISYFDALVILLALKTGAELLSFDKQQLRIYRKLKQKI